MPTASPIIVARVAVLEPRSRNAVAAVMPEMPIPMPMRAVRMGRPAATREPKVSTRTASATAMPISSDSPPGGAKLCMPWPLTSASRPSSRASSSAARTASWVAGSTSVTVSTSKAKEMSPTRPSSLSGESVSAFATASARGVPAFTPAFTIASTWAGPATPGLASAGSAGTSSTAWRSATRASTAFEGPGSVSVWPCGAATTTLTVAWSKASCACGNSSCCRSAASSEGMPGMEKVSVVGLASVAAAVPTTITATSQRAITIGQRRNEARPRR